MSRKSAARAAVKERLGAPGVWQTSWWRQVLCVMRWPFFCHAYDAVFVERPDKLFSYYEHCAICGRARSWVTLGPNNYGKPGSVVVERDGRTVEFHA